MSNISPIPHLLRAAVSILLLATLCVGGVWGQELKSKQDTLTEITRLKAEITKKNDTIKIINKEITLATTAQTMACTDTATNQNAVTGCKEAMANLKLVSNSLTRIKVQLRTLNRQLANLQRGPEPPQKSQCDTTCAYQRGISDGRKDYIPANDTADVFKRGVAQGKREGGGGWLPTLLALAIGAGIFGLGWWWLSAKYIAPELNAIKAEYKAEVEKLRLSNNPIASQQGVASEAKESVPHVWYAHGFQNGRFIPTTDKYEAWFEIVPNPYDSEKATYKLLPRKENTIDQNWADVQGAFMVSGKLRNNENQPFMVDYDQGTLRRDGDSWVPVEKIRIRRGKEEQKAEIVSQKTILYAAPPADGRFVQSEMSAKRDSDDLVFEVEMDGKNPSRAKIRFINDTGVYQQIKKLLRERVDFACQIMAGSAKMQDVEPIEDGVLVKEGGVWKVESKIKIRVKA